MPQLTQQQIFGKQSDASNLNPTKNKFSISLDLRDFQNIEDEGEIKNGKGITNLADKYLMFSEGKGGITLLYMILLLTMQNQAEHLNADPEQKIFITENSPAFGVGSRKGQIRYSYLVNIFVDSDLDNSPNANDI